MRHAACLALLALAFAPACRSEPAAPEQGLELEPLHLPGRSWTRAFQREAVLLADEIEIEGPPDLVDHVALQSDPETNLYTSQTITQGLFQELLARPEMGTPVRGQLDGWTLAALRRITVLQRPGEVPVRLRARGNVYWAAADGSEERRENELVFEGQHEPTLGGE